MESRLLSSLGKVAGLAGISVGVFLLLFRGVLQQQFLPEAGLASAQAFAVILSLMILTFGIAGIGVIAWLVSRNIRPEAPIPGWSLGILAALMALVLGSAVLVSQQAKPDPGASALATPSSPVRVDTTSPAVKTDTPEATHSVPSQSAAQPSRSSVELNAKTKDSLATCVTVSKSGPMEMKVLEELRNRMQNYGFRLVRDCGAAALSITVVSASVDEPVLDTNGEYPAYKTTAHLEVAVTSTADNKLLFPDRYIDGAAIGTPADYKVDVKNKALIVAIEQLVTRLRPH
jgi:hypothetical protein